MKNIVIGTVIFASAFVSSVLSVLIVIKGMEKVFPIVSTGKLTGFISNDTIWLTLLILIIWCIDLLVRPLIKDSMQGFLRIWSKNEVENDDGHSKANIEEC